MEQKNDVDAIFSSRAEDAPLENVSLNPTTGRYEFAAHIFDLDGVITSTEKLHFDGWKETFDKLIASLRESNLLPQGAPEEFNQKLYLDYVDGKPRYDGVRSFIDALGAGDDCLVAKIAGQVQGKSVGSMNASAFIQFITSRIKENTSPLSQAITPDKLDAIIDQWSNDPAKLAELFDQCAMNSDHLDMLLKKLVKRPVELGVIIVRKVGDIKDAWINDKLNDDSVEIVKFKHTVDMIKAAKEKGVKVAIASSSKNAKKILKKAQLFDLFDEHLIIDGIVREEMGLNGKPAPDIFVEAAKRMGVPVHRAIVFEDANSGVAAGKRGNFGLVVGLARAGNQQELKKNGADIVLTDIGDMEDPLQEMNSWYKERLQETGQRLTYIGTPMERDPEAHPEMLKARFRAEQALQAVGNGFFCTRGSDYEERQGPDSWGYAGTYFSTIRNTRKSIIEGQPVYNEDLVNCINWLPFTFKIDNGDWFQPHETALLSYAKDLDFRDGAFTRTLGFRNQNGKETEVVARHCVSMADKHLAAVEYSVTPLNYSGVITVKAGLHADHINDGVARYAKLDQQHLTRITEDGASNGTSFVRVRTRPSQVPGKDMKPAEITAAARIVAELEGKKLKPTFAVEKADRRVDISFSQKVGQGQKLTVHKMVGLHTNMDSIGTLSTLDKAHRTVANVASFSKVLGPSAVKWTEIWDKAGVEVVGDRLGQQALNLATYHLFVMGSQHNDGGIGPRGLTGETYRGHEFWDDILYYPGISLQNPLITRSLLEHRYHGLEAARKAARGYNYQGAMYPWQAGIGGDEQTQITRFNPVSGQWDPDNSCRQRHVSLAIAYNVLDFLETTGDVQFSGMGTEMVLGICRFFSSMCELDSETGKYSIDGVMGPNEFHEGKEKRGVKDNAYTNIMLAWTLEKAEHLVAEVKVSGPAELEEAYHNMGVAAEEMEKAYDHWREIRQNLSLNLNEEGVIANHSEWFNLRGPDEVKGLKVELDGQTQDLFSIVYKPGRSDRRMRAVGMDPDDYQIQKQADTLMAYYNLGPDEVKRVVRMMGYELPEDHLLKNLNHHLPRTSHGSTLSFITHAMVLANTGRTADSWYFYRQALISDLSDIQGGTTAEGIHLGVMGGCLKGVVTNFAGLNWHSDQLSINPDLPEEWESLKFSALIRGDRYHFEIIAEALKLRVSKEDKSIGETENLVIVVQDRPEIIDYDVDYTFKLGL
ncbi:MAG: HAD-IA family hydrolase [Desulfosarcina sp.]|nr:HAD-IA family hydrolase [Desulfosarcina sp.]MBC2765657.1 HAD-IA family hydrolase [Desulfosarcina sp.]